MSASRLTRIDGATLRELNEQALASPRLRRNLNLHATLDDPYQRFLNDFEPGTYVRPHRHADKWELFVLVQGAAVVLTFDDDGTVLERVELSMNAARVVEIAANTWHSVVSLEPATVLFETKPGPFDPAARAEFAAWSVPEGGGPAADFERRLRIAMPGQSIAGQ